MAVALLKKRGQMDDKGKLTDEGQQRNRMTAGERAKDRAAKDRGGKPGDYRYNPKTNAARRRRKHA